MKGLDLNKFNLGAVDKNWVMYFILNIDGLINLHRNLKHDQKTGFDILAQF